jgi:threonine synthase
VIRKVDLLAVPEFNGTAAPPPTIVTMLRDVEKRFGTVVDPHTADGLKVGREFATGDVPVICIETALPAKFAATIREALGRDPERPGAYADLEARPQRCERLPADVARVKAYIEAHARAA